MTNLNTHSLDFLKMLAHDVRWHLVLALAESDRRVQELVERLQRPQNLISYHLRLLRDGNLVRERRSSSDGRDVYYSLNLDFLRSMYLSSGQALHPVLACVDAQVEVETAVTTTPIKVLFLCTHNSARSQLAEGILRSKGEKHFQVFSAGSEVTHVQPMAIQAAAELGIDISQQQSKHMDQFVGQNFDVIITVCDKVREVCPVFPNDPYQIHWSIPDPVSENQTDEAQMEKFRQAAQELMQRINYLKLSLTYQSRD